ncbi:Clp protease N-terminal domain-containing protein [Streptomyces sp. NPDC049954]|uniref:Clp protease N-terminal domain-containing protein n=1 Tax=Streptomyces sp. NPDC049954 TaxID=3155779 RepID=UPI003443DC19
MFERFSETARTVVREAADRARRAGAPAVTEEHLLLALLEREGTRASFALTALGLEGERRQALYEDLDRARRRGGLSREDEEALAGLGIDLATIVSRVEDAHGEGALAGGAARPGRGLLGGRRLPFSRDARSVLERALREALTGHERAIGDEHLLLGLLTLSGPVPEALAGHGVTGEAVRRVLYGAAGTGGAEEGEEGERRAG